MHGELGHIRWIGGPPDAGKTTVATLLAERAGGTLYQMDRHEMTHIQRADPRHHPLHVAMRDQLERADRLDFSWVRDEPATMAERARANWTERIDLILEDLRAMPHDVPIVAEGPGFFPGVIAPLIDDPHDAVFLIPTEPFKRASHARRDKSAFLMETSDPDRARANHIARDLLLADMYREQVIRTGLRAIEIDGSRTSESLASDLAHWLSLPLE